MAGDGRTRTKGQTQSAGPDGHIYAVCCTSHECAYSTPSARSKPARLNADGLMPISRTSSSVGGCLAYPGVAGSSSRAMRTWVGAGIAVRRDFAPLAPDQTLRCTAYSPGPDDSDRRTGAERWPWLTAPCATSR